MFQRSSLVSLTTLALVALAPAAASADSTITAKVAPGGSLRSSPDAAPSPETPLIVTVYTATEGTAPSDVTITFKNKPDHDIGPDLEGGAAYALMGPQVDVSATQPGSSKDQVDKVVFEVDASLYRPGFLMGRSQFYFSFFEGGNAHCSNQTNDCHFEEEMFQRLADGDVRLTVPAGSFDTMSGSYGLKEEELYGGVGIPDGDLVAAIRHGIRVPFTTTYRCTGGELEITVSGAVARALKLKSTTIAQKDWADQCDRPAAP